MNCMRNPPAISSGSVGEKIQSRDQQDAEQGRDDNVATAAPALRKMTEQCAAADRAEIVDDRDRRDFD